MESAKDTESQILMKVPGEVPEKSKDSRHQKHSKPKRSIRSKTPQKKQESQSKCIDEETNGNKAGKAVENLNGNKNGNKNGEQSENGAGEMDVQVILKDIQINEDKKIINEEKVAHDTNESNKAVEKRPEQMDTTQQPEKEQKDKEVVEMEPLVLSDEADPELQLLVESSDNDDLGRSSSPLLNRCITRRSYTRNIPTPKTPKVVDTEENEAAQEDTSSQKKSSPKNVSPQKTPKVIEPVEKEAIPEDTSSQDTSAQNEERFDESAMDSLKSTSTDSSMKVEIGGDSTRLNFSDINNSFEHDSSYLDHLKERRLVSRRPIRCAEDYRRRVLKNAQNANLPFEQLNIGVKRKDRSLSPEESKKLRLDTSSFGSFFASPFASLKNRLKRDERPSSTPELLGYKDDRSNLHFNDNLDDVGKIEEAHEAEEEEKRNWCLLM
ncbi:unnamed protein product [Phyllotreta striolata]|uniref:Uncharacterized protein n=1 Tax=Phyllotreta striolata TaxID=444603 RepID=A0A9N9TVR5_PHYSR|nr:unnamed protein product [Phyllotreta striolata]